MEQFYNIVFQIIENFAISCIGGIADPFLKYIIQAYILYLPVILFLVFVLGFVIAFRVTLRSPFFYFIYKKFQLILLILFTGLISGFSMLYEV